MSIAYQDLRIEISVPVMGKFIRDDYGVPGSPVFDTLDDVDICGSMDINGVTYTEKELREKFGPQGYLALLSIVTDCASDAGEWEDDVPEPMERD